VTVTADADAHAPGDLHDREQSVAAGELEVEVGAGGVEPSLGAARPSSELPDDIDELVVRVDDPRDGLPYATGSDDPHR
jgi:hypothetical protein